MKKDTMKTLVVHLAAELASADEVDRPFLEQVIAELHADLDRGKAKADANRALYADYHDKVMQVLRDATGPVTAQEIADYAGIARGKVVYGLSNYWASEIVADKSGKTTTYRLLA
jgi:CRP-like cAMP-binding protein